MSDDVVDLGGLGLRLVASDALPPGTVMLVSPRQVTRVTLPDGRQVERAEPMEDWARRCGVLRMDSG